MEVLLVVCLVVWLVGCFFFLLLFSGLGERGAFFVSINCVFFWLLAGFSVGKHAAVISKSEAFLDFGSLGHLEEDLLAAAQRSQYAKPPKIHINNGSFSGQFFGK